MTESEIVTNELIVEAIDKIVEKFQKKAIKEREKAKRAYVTYKGEIFFTEDDLMGAYSGDVFSGSTHDKLLEKLRKAKKVADNELTKSEAILLLKRGEIAEDEAAKKIRVYDFLATCDKEDIYTMVDSSAFNDIIKSFCKKALENSSVSEQSAQDVINELINLFNFSCKKICNNK